jgi:hypothetical protein
MPKCSDNCQFPNLPVDNSPHVCPVGQKHFHAICSNVKYVKADQLGLTFGNSILCPTCAFTKPHLGQPGSPIPINDSESAQQKNESEPHSSEILCK